MFKCNGIPEFLTLDKHELEQLTDLCFANSDFSKVGREDSEDYWQFENQISGCMKLGKVKHVDVSGNDVYDIVGFLDDLIYYSNIRSGPFDLDMLAVTSLNLSNCAIGDTWEEREFNFNPTACRQLCQIIDRFWALRSINLSGNGLGKKPIYNEDDWENPNHSGEPAPFYMNSGFVRICKALGKLGNLESLDFSCNDFTSYSVSYLCKYLKEWQKLKFLNLSNNGLAKLVDEDQAYEFKHLCSRICILKSLESIDLTGNDLSQLNEENFNLLCTGLSNCEKLVQIKIDGLNEWQQRRVDEIVNKNLQNYLQRAIQLVSVRPYFSGMHDEPMVDILGYIYPHLERALIKSTFTEAKSVFSYLEVEANTQNIVAKPPITFSYDQTKTNQPTQTGQSQLEVKASALDTAASFTSSR